MTATTKTSIYRLTVLVCPNCNWDTCDSFIATVDDFQRYAMEQWEYTLDEWLENYAVSTWGKDVVYRVEQIA